MQAVRKIKIEEAQIKTATVEVKSLVINARKMTLSVFRQVQQENVINEETLELKGIPWGTINYFWGDLYGDVHVLWQSGNELRRSLNSKWSNRWITDYETIKNCIELKENPFPSSKWNLFNNVKFYNDWIKNRHDLFYLTKELPLEPSKYTCEYPSDFDNWSYSKSREWEDDHSNVNHSIWEDECYEIKKRESRNSL